jgi:hypothetical protein
LTSVANDLRLLFRTYEFLSLSGVAGLSAVKSNPDQPFNVSVAGMVYVAGRALTETRKRKFTSLAAPPRRQTP